MSDDELDRLKARRLEEMKRNVSAQDEPPKDEKERPSARKILSGKLGYRGMEVLQNAEAQYPAETRMVVEKLGELIESGEVTEEIDGGKLLMLLRTVGLSVRMNTKISVEQDGKFVSLSEKLNRAKEGA
ncbi:hypothetical protein CENSYa_1074 [Cenarchaeum symbiosum A]|uniref:Double-stranded DNA-binding protein n=1 Tax=Cenarchaeum symbiosum (strain A) TaxID=414004 RepID=A0RWI7_CENSY|nr:hypothetical protein CENSYa_1074 [Cenarchaeum symbiosum A]